MYFLRPVRESMPAAPAGHGADARDSRKTGSEKIRKPLGNGIDAKLTAGFCRREIMPDHVPAADILNNSSKEI